MIECQTVIAKQLFGSGILRPFGTTAEGGQRAFLEFRSLSLRQIPA